MQCIRTMVLAALALGGCKPGFVNASLAGNEPPVVSIASPQLGASFATGDAIAVEVAAVDTDGMVVSVDLLVGGALVDTAAAAPFALTWSATAGDHQLSARARDNGGAVTESLPVLVTVVPPGGNFPPTVTITSPSDGANVAGDEAVSITVSASDPDGRVARVEFFADGLPIGEATSAPFSVAWALPPPGGHTLTATAHDNGGASGDSLAVTTTVLPIADPVAGSVVVSLDFATHERARGVYLWVEDAGGHYVDTIEQYFGRGPIDGYPDGSYAVTGVRHSIDKNFDWRSAVGESQGGPLIVDGETRASALPEASGGYISAVWDCLSARGDPIPKGTYTIRLEVTFDGSGHPTDLPAHHYSGTLFLGTGDGMSNLVSSDAKVSSATVAFATP